VTVAADPFALVGKVIADKFRVERVLGEGGFGVVYAGTHLVLGLPVAIKCLKSGDPAAFLREARILFTLSHPAIVRLFDAGVVDERKIPYAALELLTGPTLLDDIQARAPMRRQYGREEIATIFGAILEGVAFAHEHGIIHRDLKPSNVMLVTDGGKLLPKVLDFGTARDAVAAIETSNASLGSGFTPLYAAPEQWDRGRGALSPRTDVYALGVTLAEMCLLEHPFPAPKSLTAILHDTLDESRRPRIALARPDLPAELETVILRALRVRPEERHANARELLLDLRSALKTSPETAPLARPMVMRASTPTPAPMTPAPMTQAPVTPIMTAPTAAIVTAPPARPEPPRRTSMVPWVLAAIFLVIAAGAIVAGVFAALRLAQHKASPPEEAAPP
jgi:eukaryotic-like serine/threonine-protein kinase